MVFKNYTIERAVVADFGTSCRIQNVVACRSTLLEAQEEHKLVCIANGDLKYAYIRGWEDDTELEAFTMFHNGMNLLTAAQFLAQVAHLGYKLDNATCFNYFNTGNERKYKARSVSYYTHRETGLSFAHVDGARDGNFMLLQEMRRTCFCFENGRIWEL